MFYLYNSGIKTQSWRASALDRLSARDLPPNRQRRTSMASDFDPFDPATYQPGRFGPLGMLGGQVPPLMPVYGGSPAPAGDQPAAAPSAPPDRRSLDQIMLDATVPPPAPFGLAPPEPAPTPTAASFEPASSFWGRIANALAKN